MQLKVEAVQPKVNHQLGKGYIFMLGVSVTLYIAIAIANRVWLVATGLFMPIYLFLL